MLRTSRVKPFFACRLSRFFNFAKQLSTTSVLAGRLAGTKVGRLRADELHDLCRQGIVGGKAGGQLLVDSALQSPLLEEFERSANGSMPVPPPLQVIPEPEQPLQLPVKLESIQIARQFVPSQKFEHPASPFQERCQIHVPRLGALAGRCKTGQSGLLQTELALTQFMLKLLPARVGLEQRLQQTRQLVFDVVAVLDPQVTAVVSGWALASPRLFRGRSPQVRASPRTNRRLAPAHPRFQATLFF